MSVIISYDVPLTEIQEITRKEERRIERALNAAVDDLLKMVGQAQILSYTSTGNPSQPPGTRYVRKFTLKGSNETERTSRNLPEISGVWRANEGKAKHAKYVLGPQTEQAPIHRGRWKSLEQVGNEVQEKAPGVIEEKLRQ
jgi:hypothetical protein